MTLRSNNSLEHARLHRQGWLCSVVLHATVGACVVLLMSGLTLSFEPDSFQWNVALVESSRSQPTIDPPPEVKPDPSPAPSPAKSQPIPPKAVTTPVQHQVAQVLREVPEVTPVNQTASTVLAQAVEHPQDSPVVETIPTEEQILEEEPMPTNEAASSETVMSAVEPLMSQPATDDSTVHPPAVETVKEMPAQVQQLNAEQMVASSASTFKAAPAAKADYGWLMRALLGRIDELKNYPVMARMNRWEGKVVLRAVIRDDGQVLMVDVQESSGRSILDNDAMETLKKASPLKLDHPLGKPQVAILMPISYSLR